MEVVTNIEMKLPANKIVFLETDEKTTDLQRNIFMKCKMYAY